MVSLGVRARPQTSFSLRLSGSISRRSIAADFAEHRSVTPSQEEALSAETRSGDQVVVQLGSKIASAAQQQDPPPANPARPFSEFGRGDRI
jgi:hypothetical protein